MKVKVEPSGCCENKGMVQVRFCMYLDPTDYGYEKHYVEVPVIPAGGYPGKVDKMGRPVDTTAYNVWFSSLPKVWQNNPFHNHFVYVEPDITDAEIMEIGKAFLAEGYIKWQGEEKLDLQNPPIARPSVIDNARLKAIDHKVQHLKETILERKI